MQSIETRDWYTQHKVLQAFETSKIIDCTIETASKKPSTSDI